MKTKLTLQVVWKKYNHLLLLLYYFVLMWLYSTWEQMIVPKYWMHSVIDDWIPFLKIFVIPYVGWYLYIIVALAYFGLRSREDFIKLCLFIFIGMTTCYVIYYFFPNGQNLRPTIQGNDIFTKMILGIWSVDNPHNVSPSMHVLDCVAVHAVIARSRLFQNKKWIVWGSFISAVLISLSTVFIKQHSILDVFFALVLGGVVYAFLYQPWKDWRSTPGQGAMRRRAA